MFKRILFLIPVAAMLFFTACQPDALTPNETGFGGYPAKMTIDNWEEFVTAPEEVIEHHRKLQRDQEASFQDASASAQKKSSKGGVFMPNNNYRGWVKAFSGAWTQMANTEVEVTFQGFPFFSEFTDLSTPYNWGNTGIATSVGVKWYFKNSGASYSQSEWVKGVSTFDLVIIQKHILGIQSFSSLRQYIAADVNFDGDIDSDDIDAIRNLILVNTNELPDNLNGCNTQNQPFFYIDGGDYVAFDAMANNGSAYLNDMYVFNCISAFPDPVTGQMPDINAYAIKRGDVTGNWTP